VKLILSIETKEEKPFTPEFGIKDGVKERTEKKRTKKNRKSIVRMLIDSY
jgi:hypothetical protein